MYQEVAEEAKYYTDTCRTNNLNSVQSTNVTRNYKKKIAWAQILISVKHQTNGWYFIYQNARYDKE